ncbi:hypothetical protein [Nonomuraea recticatena]|uniref:hypothetical protein n=1 Tax=Nonomuraea recticatena TaxID=46178 RepID=UPI0031F89DD4
MIEVDSDTGGLVVFRSGDGTHTLPVELLEASRAAQRRVREADDAIAAYVKKTGQPPPAWV